MSRSVLPTQDEHRARNAELRAALDAMPIAGAGGLTIIEWPLPASMQTIDLCPDCGQFMPTGQIHACLRNDAPFPGTFRVRLLRTTTNYRPYRL